MEEFARIYEFETIIQKALERKYANTPEVLEGILGALRFGGWNTSDFISAFRKGQAYPEERLIGCLYHVIDVKLQLYFLLEVDIGMYNTQVYDQGFEAANGLKTPDLLLRHLSFDQTLIVKARILWERIMNFVY